MHCYGTRGQLDFSICLDVEYGMAFLQSLAFSLRCKYSYIMHVPSRFFCSAPYITRCVQEISTVAEQTRSHSCGGEAESDWVKLSQYVHSKVIINFRSRCGAPAVCRSTCYGRVYLSRCGEKHMVVDV